MDFIEMGGFGENEHRDVAQATAEFANLQRETSENLEGIIQDDNGSWHDDDETETTDDEDQIYYKRDRAQEEWDESMRQLQGLVQLMLIPIIGKYLGRRFAYYAWKRYIDWKT